MRKLMRLPIVLLLVVAAGGVVEAGLKPLRYLERHDRGLTTTVNPADGSRWAAWSFRQGGDFALAISCLDESGWSEPFMIGEDDGVSQIEPSLTVDGNGTVYVTYAQSNGSVHLAWRRVGEATWSLPQALTAAGSSSSAPTARVVGDRLVIAYRNGRSVRILDVELVSPVAGEVIHGNGLQEGPDPWTLTGPVSDATSDEETLPSGDDQDAPVVFERKSRGGRGGGTD